MNRIALLTITLVTGLVAYADPPKIEVPPITTAAKGAGYVTITPKSDAKAVTFLSVDGLELLPPELLADKKTTVAIPKVAGRYRIYVIGTAGDEQSTAMTVVVVGDAPEPGPGPITPPAAVPAIPIWLVFVDESSTRTAQFARLINDTPYWTGYVGRGHSYRILDKDSTTASGYLPFVTKAGVDMPAAIVMDGAGKVLATVPAPMTPTAVNDLLKRYTTK